MSKDKLHSIGFYTLEDERAANCSHETPLWRCELLVTSRCNFNCPYCRKRDFYDLSREEAWEVLNLWITNGLRNVRFSGGEPTLWSHLRDAVGLCDMYGVERIAISTNGSADLEVYLDLIDAGVNDFSISLDACCVSAGKAMAGIDNATVWDKVVSNIRKLSHWTYVTVGVVFTEDNVHDAEEIIEFAHNLGVADIRIIPAAQVSKQLPLLTIDPEILVCHPILNYRIGNIQKGRPIRGISKTDNDQCPLVLDDMAAENGYHYPCIIYLRERGAPIGKLGDNVRQERLEWFNNHNCLDDPICCENCLDVCVDYNNRVIELGNDHASV